MASTRQTPLFGGAITCRIPIHWRDVSTVREVPDNQEVYQDCTEETGAVFVVEILQHQADVKNEDAALFFFGDLADSNGCGSEWRLDYSKVFSELEVDNDREYVVRSILKRIKRTSTTTCCVVAIGFQSVVQGKSYTGTRSDAEKSIKVEMCILRLNHVETDLLLSLSTPIDQDTTMTDAGDQTSLVFRDLVAEFCIKDWSLFG